MGLIVMANRRSAWADLNKQWAEEVASVVVAEGLPWQTTACWCEQRTSTRFAELVHRSTGKLRCVSVSTAHLETPATRRAELIRQLGPSA